MLTPHELIRLQQAAREIYVDRGVVDYAVNLVLATRSPEEYGLGEIAPLIEYGASPRASLGLVAAGRALALLRGRRYAVPQDVFDVAPEILRHRLVLSYEALAQGLVVDQITARVLSTVPAPRVTPILEGLDVVGSGSGRRRRQRTGGSRRPRRHRRRHGPLALGPRPGRDGAAPSPPRPPLPHRPRPPRRRPAPRP